MLEHFQNYINPLVALLVDNPENCRRVYDAEGVTLLVAVLVSRRQMNISQLEISCAQALCYIFTCAKTLNADNHGSMLLSAGVAKICRTTNLANKKKGISCANCGGVEKCNASCHTLPLSVHVERLCRGSPKTGPCWRGR